MCIVHVLEKALKILFAYVNSFEAKYFCVRTKSASDMYIRVRPRFFDQVGHQTTNASIGNKYFFTK